jgi:putative ABC transport system ATP-binding protein
LSGHLVAALSYIDAKAHCLGHLMLTTLRDTLTFPPYVIPEQTITPCIRLEQVVKTYNGTAGSFTALRGIDISVNSSEFIAIIGKSGSGKSTLINMITGIDRPTSGKVNVLGSALHKLTEEQIAIWRGLALGIIFQFFQLLPSLTAVENVLLSMDFGQRWSRTERPERAMQLLDLVGMAKYAHDLPVVLSGGQQQCVAIARALANDPPLLVADEPTGNLDSHAAHQILKLFEELVNSGKTILMVTHDNDLASLTQRILVIADGKIIDERFTGR